MSKSVLLTLSLYSVQKRLFDKWRNIEWRTIKWRTSEMLVFYNLSNLAQVQQLRQQLLDADKENQEIRKQLLEYQTYLPPEKKAPSAEALIIDTI